MKHKGILLACLLGAMLPGGLSQPALAEGEGHWELTDTQVVRADDVISDYGSTHDTFAYSADITEHSLRYEHSYQGELRDYLYATCTFDTPPAVGYPGDEFTIHIAYSYDKQHQGGESTIMDQCRFDFDYYPWPEWVDTDDSGHLGGGESAKIYLGEYSYSYSGDRQEHYDVPENTIIARFPEFYPYREDTRTLTVSIGNSNIYSGTWAKTIWTYSWVSEAVPAEESEPLEQTVTTEAGEDPGEDEGVDILSGILDTLPESGSGPDGGETAKKIALSVAGALAAAGVLGAAADAAGKKKRGGKKTEYKLYVYKAFGDAIRKGAKPVWVYARISQIVDGKEYDCPEQTERIQASGENLTVRAEGVRDAYLCASVSAEAGGEETRGTVSFTLTGPGGAIRRNIIFRLVDEPRIVFPGETEDGGWDLGADESTVTMAAGLGGLDKLRFVIVDAVEEPKEILFRNCGDFVVGYEADPKLRFTYYALIDNRTERAEKLGGIFADKREQEITVEAVFEDGLRISSYFTVELYPDGLSVLISGGPNPLLSKTPGARQTLKNNRLEVLSYATRDRGELTLDPVIPPTGFDLCYAVMTPEGSTRIGMEPGIFQLQKLEPTDEATKKILAKLRCEVRWHIAGFAVRPGDSLPEMEGEYRVTLPVDASLEGYSEHGEIPIRLLGEPFDPRKNWDAEFKALCTTVIRYYPGEIAHKYVQYIKQNFSYPEIWDASELRMMRYETIRAAQDYWTRQYDAQLQLVEWYDLTEKIFKKPPRFIADMAFKILAKYYWGENESWITPCKDLIVDTVDEAIWNYAYTGSAKVDIVDKLLEQGTNTLENYISVGNASAALAREEQKKLFFVLTAYILADWVKNYYSMSPKDFWECWRKTWFDMTAMALKKLVGVGLERAMSSKAVNRFFNSKLMQKVNEQLPGMAKGKLMKPGAEGSKAFTKAGNVDLSSLREDGVWKATHRPSGREMFILLEDMSYVGYREIVQTLLDDIFGRGIAWLTENAEETVRDDTSWRGLAFPIKASWLGLEGDYEDMLVKLDAVKFFSSDTGLSSEGFNMLFESLFGPAAPLVHKLRSSDDPAKEILSFK